jgi:hypothetical protein
MSLLPEYYLTERLRLWHKIMKPYFSLYKPALHEGILPNRMPAHQDNTNFKKDSEQFWVHYLEIWDQNC